MGRHGTRPLFVSDVTYERFIDYCRENKLHPKALAEQVIAAHLDAIGVAKPTAPVVVDFDPFARPAPRVVALADADLTTKKKSPNHRCGCCGSRVHKRGARCGDCAASNCQQVAESEWTRNGLCPELRRQRAAAPQPVHVPVVVDAPQAASPNVVSTEARVALRRGSVFAF